MSRMRTWETLSLQNSVEYKWHGAAISVPVAIHINGSRSQRLGQPMMAALSVLASAHAGITH